MSAPITFGPALTEDEVPHEVTRFGDEQPIEPHDSFCNAVTFYRGDDDPMWYVEVRRRTSYGSTSTTHEVTSLLAMEWLDSVTSEAGAA